jgi:hypothetical protein
MVSSVSSIHSRENETPAGDDWPAQMAESIERVVGSVRDKTTGPALKVSRAVVYGTFAAVVAIAAIVLFVILLVRIVDVYLPEAVFGESHTWATHMILGVLFSIAGIVCWVRRRPQSAEQSAYDRR